jgi:hypothetical protein
VILFLQTWFFGRRLGSFDRGVHGTIAFCFVG